MEATVCTTLCAEREIQGEEPVFSRRLRGLGTWRTLAPPARPQLRERPGLSPTGRPGRAKVREPRVRARVSPGCWPHPRAPRFLFKTEAWSPGTEIALVGGGTPVCDLILSKDARGPTRNMPVRY